MLAGVQRAVLIVNPYSTKVTGDRIARVEATLREQVELRTEFTRGPGHATELAAEAEGKADAIVVFAGDGTYNEAMNGADGALPFGFLPGGGTSVFPRALGLPRDPGAAARVVATAIAERRTRRISLGSVNGRRFCFSAGIGFDGEAVRRLDQLGRDAAGARPGDAAFVHTVWKMIAERHGRWDPAARDRGSRAGRLHPCRQLQPVHLMPDRCRCRSSPTRASSSAWTSSRRSECVRGSVPRLLAYIVTGKGQLSAGDVYSGHDLDRIVVHCDRPLPLQADGEDLGDVETAVFEAMRDAVSVLV